jgi:hypothetical protein
VYGGLEKSRLTQSVGPEGDGTAHSRYALPVSDPSWPESGAPALHDQSPRVFFDTLITSAGIVWGSPCPVRGCGDRST